MMSYLHYVVGLFEINVCFHTLDNATNMSIQVFTIIFMIIKGDAQCPSCISRDDCGKASGESTALQRCLVQWQYSETLDISFVLKVRAERIRSMSSVIFMLFVIIFMCMYGKSCGFLAW